MQVQPTSPFTPGRTCQASSSLVWTVPTCGRLLLTMNSYKQTRQDLANAVAERWRGMYTYFLHGARLWRRGEAIYNRLVALGPTPNPDDVDRTIGNGSWTRLKCDGCDTETDEVVIVGQEQNYDSSTASLCKKCIAEAYQLLHVTPSASGDLK